MLCVQKDFVYDPKVFQSYIILEHFCFLWNIINNIMQIFPIKNK